MHKLRFLLIVFVCLSSSFLFSQQRINIGAKEKKEILDAHNQERNSLGSPDLVWDEKLADYAFEWANKLAKSEADLKHRPKDDFGENLSFWSGLPFDATFGVKMWLDEKRDYKYGKYGKQKGMIGHYTQLVWKTTKKVGCGCAKSKKGAYYFVCNYDPPGNWIGQYPY